MSPLQCAMENMEEKTLWRWLPPVQAVCWPHAGTVWTHLNRSWAMEESRIVRARFLAIRARCTLHAETLHKGGHINLGNTLTSHGLKFQQSKTRERTSCAHPLVQPAKVAEAPENTSSPWGSMLFWRLHFHLDAIELHSHTPLSHKSLDRNLV